jgi:hypothetical protein
MLSNQRFYYSLTRKAVVAFGSLFSNLYITRSDESGNKKQSILVPLSYANKHKWLASIINNPDKEDRQVQTILPKMAFEITNYEYVVSRKMNSNQVPNKYIVNPSVAGTDPSIGIPKPNANQLTSSMAPAPYTLTFKLYIAAKNHDDILQIVEQIIPYFNPTYSMTVNWIPELNVKSDFPITLKSVEPSDSYEGILNDRREIIWTLTFTSNINYYGASTAVNVIKKVDIDLHASMNEDSDPNVSYHVEVNPLTANATDPYTFMESWSYKD